MGQTSLMTGGTNKKLQTAGGKRTLIQVAQCDQGSLFSRILKILGAFATVYSQYRALHSLRFSSRYTWENPLYHKLLRATKTTTSSTLTMQANNIVLSLP